MIHEDHVLPRATEPPFLSAFHAKNTTKGVGAGKRRGLGPRNDVLTTCKAVTQRSGQRIIRVFFPQEIFLDFLEARSEPAEEIRNA